MNDKTDRNIRHDNEDNANRDPITDEPGSHPVGTSLGAAGAGLAGAIVGAGVAGPLGATVGAAIGGSLGGALGHEAAEAANPTYVAVEPHLRRDFSTRTYANNSSYEEYEGAYVFGTAERERMNSPWNDEVERDLRTRWDTSNNRNGNLDWDRARPAVRDAWNASDRVPRK